MSTDTTATAVTTAVAAADEAPLTWRDTFPWLDARTAWKDEPIDLNNSSRLHEVVSLIVGHHSAKRLGDCFPYLHAGYELHEFGFPPSVARYWAGRGYDTFDDVAGHRVRAISDIPQVGRVMWTRSLAKMAAENVRAAVILEHAGDEIERAVGTRDFTPEQYRFDEPFVALPPRGDGAAATDADTATGAGPAPDPAPAPAPDQDDAPSATPATAPSDTPATTPAGAGAGEGAADVAVAAAVDAAPAQPAPAHTTPANSPATAPDQIMADVAVVAQWLADSGKATMTADTPGLLHGVSGAAADALDRLRATPALAWTNQTDYTTRFSRRIDSLAAGLRQHERHVARHVVFAERPAPHADVATGLDLGAANVPGLVGQVKDQLAQAINADTELHDFAHAVLEHCTPGTPIVDVVGTFPVLTDPVPALGAPLWRVIERLSAVLDLDAGFTVRDGRCVPDRAD